jgi:predicted enzyme related to lactoylglutathione lyase
MQESSEMDAPILEWQMVTTNPDQLAKFYGDLFGWKTSTTNALGYRQIDTGDGSLRGGLWPSPPTAHSFVQLFVGVPDVDTSVTRATELGARVIVPRTALPDGDEMAILADPCGITFGVVRRAASLRTDDRSV